MPMVNEPTQSLLTPEDYANFMVKLNRIIDHYDGAFSSVDLKSREAATKLNKIIQEAEIILKQTIETNNKSITDIANNLKGFDYVNQIPPTITTNPLKQNAVYLDGKNGDIWVCLDNTPNNNIWRSVDGKTISPNQPPLMAPVLNFTKVFFSGASYDYIFNEGVDVDGEIKYYEVFDIDNPLVTVIESKVLNGSPIKFKIQELEGLSESNVSFKVRCYDDLGVRSEPVIIQVKISQGLAKESDDYGAFYGCNHSYAKLHGLRPAENCEDPKHENFATYLDDNDNEFVCIPLQYYKQDFNDIHPLTKRPYYYVSNTPKPDYAPFMCFLETESPRKYREALFIAKYQAGNNLGVDVKEGVACSKKGVQPVVFYPYSAGSLYNSTNQLKGVASYYAHYVRESAKSAGTNYTECWMPIYFMFNIMQLARTQSLLDKYKDKKDIPDGLCDWLKNSINQNCYSKGLDNGTSNQDDSSLKYETALNTTKFRTGTSNKPSETSLNGQNQGIQDLWGNVWEVTTGLANSYSGYEFMKYVTNLTQFKSAINFTSLASTSTTHYYFSSTAPVNNNYGKAVSNVKERCNAYGYTNTTSPLYSGVIDVTNYEYELDNYGMIKSPGLSSQQNKNISYGGSCYYAYKNFYYGGIWLVGGSKSSSTSGTAGRGCFFRTPLNTSAYHLDYGFRLMVHPK